MMAKKPAQPLIPPALDTPLFKTKWDEWLTYRRQMGFKKYKTNRAILHLALFAVPVAIQAIDASMRHEYQGLFPERFGREINPGSSGKLRSGGRVGAPDGKYAHLDDQGPLPFIRPTGTDGGGSP